MRDISSESLRNHAQEIWRAGVWAVDSERLVRDAIVSAEECLIIAGHVLPLANIGRIVVVGAGKAGAGMAAGFEAAVPESLLQNRVSGWINVPADCVRTLQKVHLHPARPAGINEPTAEGAMGSERILELVSELTSQDVCIVLLSGGGSALLPAPAEGISLADKQAITRMLMHSGASIQELNTVRKQLSKIKGGRLAAATKAGLILSLIISDVIGDPLDVIASGPTVADSATAEDALAILSKFDPNRLNAPDAVWTCLEHKASKSEHMPFPAERVHNHIIGSNRVALDAAAKRAIELGYAVESLGSDNADEAQAVGRNLARLARKRKTARNPSPVCLLSGGEPVVHLAPTKEPRKGGRNQEVALAALVELGDEGLENIVVLSGGTDGEDGPTDAAGAFSDAGVHASAIKQHLDPTSFLAINNSYPFFEQTGGLLKTGPTHTNVMDLRVVLVAND